MSTLLAAVVSHTISNDISKKDLEATSHVLTALASSQPDIIKAELTHAKEKGINLNQVGTVALYANARQVARVLRKDFNIKIENYLTTGEEKGTSSLAGYPILLNLAYHHDVEIQERALEWGANPNAVWTVKKQNDYSSKRNTPVEVSWISENIARANKDFTIQLLKDSDKNVSPAEEERRIIALASAHHAYTTDHISDIKKMVKLFQPGGAYATKLSPWDIEENGTTLAVERLAREAYANSSLHEHMGGCVLNEWSKQTMPEEGNFHVDVLRRCIERGFPSKNKEGDLRFTQWCIELLSPDQAQEIMALAWEKVFFSWISKNNQRLTGHWNETVTPDRQSYLDQDLESQLSPLKRVTEIALSTEVSNHFTSPFYLLRLLNKPEDILKFTPASLDALINHFPKNNDNPEWLNDMRDLRETITELKVLDGATDNSSNDKKQQLKRHILALSETAILLTHTQTAPKKESRGLRL